MPDNSNSSRLKRRTTSKTVNYVEQPLDVNSLFGSSSDSSDEEITKKKRRSETNSRTSTNSPNSSNSTNAGASSSHKKFKYQSFLNEKKTQWNLIPLLPPSYRKTSKFSNVLDLDEAFVDLEAQIIYNTEAILIEKDESIYMVSEPPGEPYYIGRVVEFVAKPEFAEEIAKAVDKVTKYPVRFFNVKMNWYYRPRDIQEDLITFNPRKVFASLNHDICPIDSYRGKCMVVHKAELQDVLPNEREEIVRSNVFYFDSLFDRYTHQYYTVYPTGKLLTNFKNIPSFLYALEKKHRYVYTEENYPLLKILTKYVFKESYDKTKKISPKEPTDTVNENDDNDKDKMTWDKRCQECHEWCLPHSSLECDDCGQAIHLYCLDPPISKKPGKRIAWVCSFCVKKQSDLPEDKKYLETELKKIKVLNQQCKDIINQKAADAISKSFDQKVQRHWFQYIGCYIISHMTDILDDAVYLPYPFKISRYGKKFQWSKCFERDAPILYPYDTNNQEERGTTESSKLLWITDKDKILETDLDAYVEKCKDKVAPLLKVEPTSCNFLDYILRALIDFDYDTDKAFFHCMNTMFKPLLHEPTFTSDEIKRFEEGVKKYGGELRPVCKHVGTQSMSMIVRFYYSWKKTERGMKIRGKRKSKNLNKASNITGKLDDLSLEKSTDLAADPIPVLYRPGDTDEIEMRYMDDSSFDTDRVAFMNTIFHCLFCDVDYSPMWYKVTGGSDDESSNKRLQTGVNGITQQSNNTISKKLKEEKMGALCIRCARLWRRYGIRWVHPLAVIRRMHGSSVASYHNSLENILDETNINKLTLSPERAKKKYLEWELVQDTELITRQRWEIMKDYRKFSHMTKQSMTFHSVLTKTVRRPFNKYTFTPEKLHSDLSSFITERCDPSFHFSTKKASSPAVQTPVASGKGVELPNDTDTPTQNSTTNISDQTCKIINKSISQKSGGTDLIVNFDTDNFKGLKITVDKKFKNVTLNDSIVQMFLNGLTDVPEQILQQLKNNSPPQETPNPSSNVAARLSDSKVPQYYSQFTTERDTTSQIECYRMLALRTRRFDSIISSKTDTKAKVSNCDVCSKSVFYPSNGILCHECGLMCHKSCYGKRSMKIERGQNWLCDVCSNSSNPIVSTQYKCCLCPNLRDAQKKTHTRMLACGGALKPTSDGRWCHIICSLFNDTIQYGNPENFEPAMNVDDAIWNTRDQKCEVCDQSGGGLVQCEQCPDYFHVSCIQSEKQSKLLLKKEILSQKEMDSHVTIINDQNDNSKYILSPVVVCKKHMAQNLTSTSYHSLTSSSGNKFMINLFTKCSKSSESRNLVFAKYKEAHSRSKTKNDVNIPDDFQTNKSDIYNIRKQQICKSCGSSTVAFWYRPDLCHCCHVAQISGDKEFIEEANESNIDLSSQYLSDDIKNKLLEDIDFNRTRLS